MSPLRAALLAQIFGALIAVGLVALVYPRLLAQLLAVAGLQGLCAAYVGHKLEAPPWWIPIHLVFMPCVVFASGLGLPSGWYLGAFALLLLVFWRVDQSRVPLYLSNEETAAAVAALLPNRPSRVIDLGCGNGVLLTRLARLRPDSHFLGVEHAPLPWLWARLVSVRVSNCQIRLGSFWRESLAAYDVVYAFLSPAPMSRLWMKAQTEMAPEAVLVSNGFPIPDVEPEKEIQVAGRRSTSLYCYRPAAPAPDKGPDSVAFRPIPNAVRGE